MLPLAARPCPPRLLRQQHPSNSTSTWQQHLLQHTRKTSSSSSSTLQHPHGLRRSLPAVHEEHDDQEQQQRQQQAAAEASVQQLLVSRSHVPPERFIGPVQLSRVPGKRFGLTATRSLAVGELLLVSMPLAVAFEPAGMPPPSNDQLVEQLVVMMTQGHGADEQQQQQQQQQQQLAWLHALHRSDETAAAGDDDGASAAEEEEERLLLQLQRLLQQQPDILDASAEQPLLLSAEQLAVVVAENAYAEAAEDAGAALLRELEPEAVTGLWPEFALLNHSCVPNTQVLCVGRYLLLRAAVPVLAGEELTCSYLGPRALSPVTLRRAFLQGVYRFHCVCPRCLAEQRAFPTQRYPQDDALLLLPSVRPGSSSSSSKSGLASHASGLITRLFGGNHHQQQQPGGPEAPAQPQPSQHTHGLLLRLHQDTEQELRTAVAEAAAAGSRRLERQLQLLTRITDRADAAVDAVAAATAADPVLQEQQPAASRWLLAAVGPLLQLQLELLELLLASSGLPLDDVDKTSGLPRRSSSRAEAARSALSQLSGSSSSSASRGAPAWLSALWPLAAAGHRRLGGASRSGPLTKRLLLALYAESLQRYVDVLDAVARGSEAHLAAAIKHADTVTRLAGAGGKEGAAAALAETLCSRAHAARYGVLRGRDGQALLRRLICTRQRRLLGQSLAHTMSVYAWEDALATLTGRDSAVK